MCIKTELCIIMTDLSQHNFVSNTSCYRLYRVTYTVPLYTMYMLIMVYLTSIHGIDTSLGLKQILPYSKNVISSFKYKLPHKCIPIYVISSIQTTCKLHVYHLNNIDTAIALASLWNHKIYIKLEHVEEETLMYMYPIKGQANKQLFA